MHQKPIPSGYHVEELGIYQRLVRDCDGVVIGMIEPYRIKNQLRNENFIMSMFERDDREAEALSTFYGNYRREIQARKQGGKENMGMTPRKYYEFAMQQANGEQMYLPEEAHLRGTLDGQVRMLYELHFISVEEYIAYRNLKSMHGST
ncbi:MAG: hypothetical protein K2I07_00130 [Lachnospiraceae bacterium]|nr:hypothetical protein [Lachnospiraceae bacterium]